MPWSKVVKWGRVTGAGILLCIDWVGRPIHESDIELNNKRQPWEIPKSVPSRGQSKFKGSGLEMSLVHLKVSVYCISFCPVNLQSTPEEISASSSVSDIACLDTRSIPPSFSTTRHSIFFHHKLVYCRKPLFFLYGTLGGAGEAEQWMNQWYEAERVVFWFIWYVLFLAYWLVSWNSRTIIRGL